MSTQPDALRLADELEMWTLGEPAAVELRRLHTENVELREAIKRAIRIEQAQPVECMCGLCKLNTKQPLTDEQADELVRRFARYELLRAVEAAHSIKENT